MDWQCSGCGRHFNYTVVCCPFCHYLTTVTTGGTQPASTNTAMRKLPTFDEFLNWSGDPVMSHDLRDFYFFFTGNYPQ